MERIIMGELDELLAPREMATPTTLEAHASLRQPKAGCRWGIVDGPAGAPHERNEAAHRMAKPGHIDRVSYEFERPAVLARWRRRVRARRSADEAT